MGRAADPTASLQLRVLGPLEAWRGEAPVPLGGRRQRAVLAALICGRGRPLTTDELVHAVWGDRVPPSAVGSLQAYLSRLRRLLGPEAITRDASGYRLATGAVDVDADAFAVDLEAADAARERGEVAEAAVGYRTALVRWRGDRFLGEFGTEPFAAGEAARLAGRRRHALRMRIDVDLDLGHHDAVVGDLEAALEDEPFDEHLWAQLMIAHHRGGRPLDALRSYRRADRTLREELGVGPGARLRALEARILAQDPALDARVDDAVRRAAAAHPTNLRDSTTSFVGRQDELAALLDRLSAERLVTVVGVGGVGKTRLAVEAGWRLVPSSPGGVWDVDLAPIADPKTVTRPLARALQVPFRAGEVGLARYAERLGDRPTVLVLDNCEHQIDAVRVLAAELLARCEGLRVLATSQRPLELEGERVVALGPLSTEDGTALALFLDRAGAVVPGFRPSAANRDAIDDLLHRLDGLPLAIELAAATLELLTPRLLADRLARGLADLHDPGTSDPRHATLHATIAWSHELLTEPHQRLLERLAVFAGPFAAAAATAVAGTEPVATDQVPDALRTLARRSLLVPVADTADGRPRWRMLEVVRAFGRSRLRARGEDQVVRSRHLAYLADLVDAAAAHRHDAEQGVWVARLREIDADLDVALATAVDRDDRSRRHQLVSGAWLWWYLDERHDDALTWLDRIGEETDPPAALLAAGALVHAVQLEDEHRDRALALVDRALTRAGASGDAGERAYVQLLVGDALTRTPQRYEEAEQQLIAAEQHFRAHGPAWAEGWALLRRIRVDGFHRADLAAARDRLTMALARLEEAGDRQLLAYANLVLANISRLQGTLEQGLTAIAAAIRSYEDLGYVLPLRECRHLQGLLLTELGRLDDAAERWRAQRTDAERTGSATGRFFAALGLAEVQARRGAHAEAAGRLEAELRAWTGTDEAGVLGPLLVVLTRVAALLATTPAHVDRVAVLRDGLLRAWGEGPVPWHQVRAHLAAGEAALALADHPTAVGHLDEAARLAGTAAQPHRLAEVAEARAVLAAVDGGAAVEVLTLLGGAARLRADTGAAAWHHVVVRNAELAAAARGELGAGGASAAWQRGERLGPAVVPETAATAGR